MESLPYEVIMISFPPWSRYITPFLTIVDYLEVDYLLTLCLPPVEPEDLWVLQEILQTDELLEN